MAKDNGKILPDLSKSKEADGASKALVPSAAPVAAVHAVMAIPSTTPATPAPAPLAAKTIAKKWKPGTQLGRVVLYPADFVKCPDEATITMLVTANPKRQEPQLRLQALLNGAITTVGQYRAKYGIKLANEDFSWDVNHGFYVVNWSELRGGVVKTPIVPVAA